MRASTRLAVVALGALFASTAVHGRDYALRDLRIERPMARATAAGARTGGAYFTILNMGSAPDRLLRVASPAAASAELHASNVVAGVMTMRPVGAVDIPAGGRIVLAPGGLHVMLVDLARPLVAGDAFPMTLTFERAGSVDVSVRIEPLTPRGGPQAAHAH
jgi:copper(I)-binding protein